MGFAAVSLREFTAEELDGHAEREVGEFGVVAVTFVAEEGVGGVEFVPREIRAGGGERGVNLGAAFGGNVRVLTTPDHEELAFDFRNTVEGVVVHALTECALVDVGGVEASRGEDVRVHRGAEGEMAAEADAEGAEFAGAVRVGGEVVEDGAGVGVVGGDGLGGLQGVAAVGAGLIVGEDGAGGFVFVVDFGDGDDEAVAGEKGGRATDGAGDLENLRVEDEAGIAAERGGLEKMRAHRAGGRGETEMGGVGESHGARSEELKLIINHEWTRIHTNENEG